MVADISEKGQSDDMEDQNATDRLLQMDVFGNAPQPQGPVDNVTDWCLEQFQNHYTDIEITKDAIWEYLYGVMHAPDWRKRYKHDLQRNLPRVPLAPDFEAFRSAGRELMDLHIGYETGPELDLECRVGGQTSNGEHGPDSYRIPHKSMKWPRIKNQDDKWEDDKTTLIINHKHDCVLVGIPEECHQYTISGRSPLEWAVTTLVHKEDKGSEIKDDPNDWHVWQDDPWELIRHLRRLAYIGKRSAEIIGDLPDSLTD